MKDIELGTMKTMYQGTIFSIKQQEVTLPDGTKTIFEYAERPPSVSILAFNEQDELLMIDEYRHGYKKNIWFLPGGRHDVPEETTVEAAQRELREETGYRADTIQLLTKKHPSNTLLWDIYIYIAKDLVYDPLPTDMGEIITPHFIPLETAATMAIDGTIENEFISYNILRFAYLKTHDLITWHD